MNVKKLLISGAAASILLAVPAARAQTTTPTLYQMALSGTVWTTNSTGHILPYYINNRTLLKQVADADGITDFSSWALAYHVGGNALGDTIDIINRTDGTVFTTLYGLYFGESFGRMSLLSASGKQLKRIEYIYTDQNSHSLGSAFLTDYYFFDASGNTNNIVILGQMQWLVVPDSTHSSMQVYTASFTTTGPFRFP